MGSHRSLDRDLAIADHFPPPDLDRWRQAAEESLGGRAVDSLASTTLDGLVVKPVYSSADIPDPLVAADIRGGRWQACRRLVDADPDVARAEIAGAASLGVDVAWVILDRRLGSGHESPPREGVVLADAAAVGQLVEGHPGTGVRLILDGGGASLPLAAALAAVSSEEGPWRALAAIYHDPLGALAADGDLPVDVGRALALLPDLAAFTNRTAPDLRTVAASTLPYAAAGATAAQELAFLLATGVEYLRALTTAGLGVAAACRQLSFVVTVGRDLFVAQAKLRAARRLWGRVVEVCGAPEAARGTALHAVTSPRTLTVRDRWTNVLRATVEAFAAVTGGADVLTILPFDAAGGPPSDEAPRLAALTHAILREEATLERVVDPAAGSYYVEWLTEGLARTAWAELQRLEESGGMARALLDGTVRSELEAAAARRREAVAQGLAPITGVSSFPDLAEEPPVRERPRPSAPPSATGRRGRATPTAELGRLVEAATAAGDGSVTAAAIAAFRAGATLAEVTAALGGDHPPASIDLLPRVRDAEPFEALRDGADWFARHHGHRPHAFLAAVGPPAEHRTAAMEAANLLAAGGIEVSQQHGWRSVAEAAEAFAASGTRVAVICVATRRRDELVAPLARALKEHGARRVLMVARPEELQASWRRAGVDAALGEGCDLVALLHELLELAGVPR